MKRYNQWYLQVMIAARTRMSYWNQKTYLIDIVLVVLARGHGYCIDVPSLLKALRQLYCIVMQLKLFVAERCCKYDE